MPRDLHISGIDLSTKKRQFVAPEHAMVMTLNIHVPNEHEARAAHDLVKLALHPSYGYVGFFPKGESGYRVEVVGKDKESCVASLAPEALERHTDLNTVRHHTLELVLDLLVREEYMTGRQAEGYKGQLETYVRSTARIAPPTDGPDIPPR
jgi:hypothetical protein